MIDSAEKVSLFDISNITEKIVVKSIFSHLVLLHVSSRVMQRTNCASDVCTSLEFFLGCIQ